MGERKRSTAAITGIVILYILASYVEALPATYEYRFNYGGFPYWIRSECREIARYGGRVDYKRAFQCSKNTVELLRREEMRKAQLENIKANTKLANQLTKRLRGH